MILNSQYMSSFHAIWVPGIVVSLFLATTIFKSQLLNSIPLVGLCSYRTLYPSLDWPQTGFAQLVIFTFLCIICRIAVNHTLSNHLYCRHFYLFSLSTKTSFVCPFGECIKLTYVPFISLVYCWELNLSFFISGGIHLYYSDSLRTLF